MRMKDENDTSFVSMLKRIGVSSAIFLIVVMIGAAVVSWMVKQEYLSTEHIAYAAFVILLMASMLALFAVLKIYGREIKVAVVPLLCNIVLIAAMGALMGGGKGGLLPASLVIFAGSVVPYLLTKPSKKKFKYTGGKR